MATRIEKSKQRTVQIPVMVTEAEHEIIMKEMELAKKERRGLTRSTFCAQIILERCKR